jgi:hypothetical protein
MISENIKKQITAIWDNYIANNQTVLDTKGNELEEIDTKRNKAIDDIQLIISTFQDGNSNIYEFKSSLDSYNKRNNLWGFTATKGQMFFNQLTKTNEKSIDQLSHLLKEVISEPKDLTDALDKIEKLELYTDKIFQNARDKRKVPNPGSIGYFLSYFWQIHNQLKWPIIYTSLQNAYTELGIWENHPTQKDEYAFFFRLNEEIKNILSNYTKKSITNWDAEHAFWNFKGNPNKQTPKKKIIEEETIEIPSLSIKATFDIRDYLIPRVANLVEIGNQIEKSGSAKGSQFEKVVSEIFKLLDFEVEVLGQGTRRNPDAIIKFREDNTAFIVDAKAYSNGYNMGLDDRAIKEYINHNCQRLIKDGFKKVGFIIVSNSYKSTFDGFINEITWNTEIRRFILLTSEALLYLLAFKTRDNLTLDVIIEKLVGCGNPVTSESIIQVFDDV